MLNTQNKPMTIGDLPRLEKRKTELIVEEQRILEELRTSFRAASELQVRVTEIERGAALGELRLSDVETVRGDHARAAALTRSLEETLAAHRSVMRASAVLVGEAKEHAERALLEKIAQAEVSEDDKLAEKLRLELRAIRGGPKPPESVGLALANGEVKIVDERGATPVVLFEPGQPAPPLMCGRSVVTPPKSRWDR